jgi:hypothetical protein
MSYFADPESIGYPQTAGSIERLFVEIWVNALQNKSSMLLGPPPFSVLSLLESLHQVAAYESLHPTTIQLKVRAAIACLARCAWIRLTYRNWNDLSRALEQASSAWTAATRALVVESITHLLSFFSTTRVSAHIEFILSLQVGEEQLAYSEITDLLADLLALGHSESFLYGFGRSVLLGTDVTAGSRPFLRDRIALLCDLGRPRQYSVAFKIRPASAWIPRTDKIFVGKHLKGIFTTVEPFKYAEGETGALVQVEAPDYKSAVGRASSFFLQHTRSLRLTNEIRKIEMVGDEFKFRCDQDSEERTIASATVKPYEPPPLTMGNALWLMPDNNGDARSALERALFWLAESRCLRGEAEFMMLWLALCALFCTDDVRKMVRPLARYRMAWLAGALAHWITDLVSQAYGRYKATVPDALARRFRFTERRELRTSTIVQAALTNASILSTIAGDSPLLLLRIKKFAALNNPAARATFLEDDSAELAILLPWYKSVRHGVAHLGTAATSSLELANRHLLEDVTIVFDHMAAAIIGEKCTSVHDIHQTTMTDFDSIMAQTFAEQCVLVTHARSAKCPRVVVPTSDAA